MHSGDEIIQATYRRAHAPGRQSTMRSERDTRDDGSGLEFEQPDPETWVPLERVAQGHCFVDWEARTCRKAVFVRKCTYFLSVGPK